MDKIAQRLEELSMVVERGFSALEARVDVLAARVDALSPRPSGDGTEDSARTEGDGDNRPKEQGELKVCSGCKESFAKLALCSNCRSARFCTDVCFKANWKRHRSFCKANSINSDAIVVHAAAVPDAAVEIALCVACSSSPALTLSFCGHPAYCASCMHVCSTANRSTSLRCPICRAPAIFLGSDDPVARAVSLVLNSFVSNQEGVDETAEESSKLLEALAHAKTITTSPMTSIRFDALSRLLCSVKNESLADLSSWPSDRRDAILGILCSTVAVASTKPEVEKLTALRMLFILAPHWRYDDVDTLAALFNTPFGLTAVCDYIYPFIDKPFASCRNVYDAVEIAMHICNDGNIMMGLVFIRVLTCHPHSSRGDTLFGMFLQLEPDQRSEFTIAVLMSYAHKFRAVLDLSLLKQAALVAGYKTEGAGLGLLFYDDDHSLHHYQSNAQYGSVMYKAFTEMGGRPVFDSNGSVATFANIKWKDKKVADAFRKAGADFMGGGRV